MASVIVLLLMSTSRSFKEEEQAHVIFGNSGVQHSQRPPHPFLSAVGKKQYVLQARVKSTVLLFKIISATMRSSVHVRIL